MRYAELTEKADIYAKLEYESILDVISDRPYSERAREADEISAFWSGTSENEEQILANLTAREAPFRGSEASPFQSPQAVMEYYREHFDTLFQAKAAMRDSHAARIEFQINGTEFSHAQQEQLEGLKGDLAAVAADIGTVIGFIYDKTGTYRTHEDVPDTLKSRTNGLFSGSLAPLREWNQDVANNGKFAHYAAYALQDFRNSDVANKIRDMYEKFHAEGKTGKQLLLEREVHKAIIDSIPDDTKNFIDPMVIVQAMTETALRPPLFDPLINPRYHVVEFYDGETPSLPEFSVRTAMNEGVLIGKNQEGGLEYIDEDQKLLRTGQWLNIEGNGGSTSLSPYESWDDLIRQNNQNAISVNYYMNHQPNFRFFHANGDQDHFKTYLGAKGSFLWYGQREANDHGKSTSLPAKDLPLDYEQIRDLKKFFRWDNDIAAPASSPAQAFNHQPQP